MTTETPDTENSAAFTTQKDIFAEAVTWTVKHVPTRPAVPILTGILVTAQEDNTVTLSVFDYETSSRCSIEASVDTPGQFLVSGRLLGEISRALPNQPVHIHVSGTSATIKCGRSTFSLVTMPVGDYPSMPDVEHWDGVIPYTQFQEAVSQVAIACNRDERYPALTGIKIDIDGSHISMVATDRYRLAVRELTWTPEAEDYSASLLVPAKILQDIAKNLTGDITFAFVRRGDKELVAFSSQGRVVTTLLLSAPYPKVMGLFPAEFVVTTLVRTADLREAVRRAALVSEPKEPVKFTFTDDALTLQAGRGGDAQAVEVIASTAEKGMENFSEPNASGKVGYNTGFNPSYINEVLGVLRAPVVRFSMTQPSNAVVITGLKEAPAEAASEQTGESPAANAVNSGDDSAVNTGKSAIRVVEDDNPVYRHLLMPIMRN